MSRQNAGLRKEHEIANEIYELTGGSVMPLRCGYSGNQATPSPDLLVPLNGSLRALEIKTSDQKRMVIDRDDLEDIIEWSLDMTEVPTFPYITVKFSRWEAQTYRLPMPWNLDASLEYVSKTCPFDSNVTQSGNISFGHPTHYDTNVPSARKSPGDAAAVLRDLEEDERAAVQSSDVVGVHDVLKEYPDYWKSRQ